MLPKPPGRKNLRLNGHDYNKTGAYFITLCTKDRQALLGRIVGAAHPGGPVPQLSVTGKMVQQYIDGITAAYPSAQIEKYVIMPNHLHLILRVNDGAVRCEGRDARCAAPMAVSRVIGTLKSLTTRKFGVTLWQRSFYDHIIRDEADYQTKWEYIDTNPARWAEDEYFV